MTTMTVKRVKGKQLHIPATLDTPALNDALRAIGDAKPGQDYTLLDEEREALEAVQRHPLTMKFEPVPGCSA